MFNRMEPNVNSNISRERLAEIEEIAGQSNTTKRPTVQSLEEILYQPIPVLDHGFIRIIDYMGDDSAIVQAARVSYGKGTKKINEDKGLIHYLMRHSHTTPFEMCEIKFHIKLPIFVARQWIRHRTANVNEYSARYSILDREFYLPAPEHLAAQSSNNRQGRGDTLEGDEAARVMDLLKHDSQTCYNHYLEILNIDDATGDVIDPNRSGLARELARMNLTLNYYTQWYWKIDLHNLLHFLRLRADSHAQYEIRIYAEKILDVLAKWLPITHEAFVNYQLNGVRLSASALNAIKLMIKGDNVSQENSGMSKREWGELMGILCI